MRKTNVDSARGPAWIGPYEISQRYAVLAVFSLPVSPMLSIAPRRVPTFVRLKAQLLLESVLLRSAFAVVVIQSPALHFSVFSADAK